jgi:hypothetical protein
MFEYVKKGEAKKKSGPRACLTKFFLRPPQVCAVTKTKLANFFCVKRALLPYVWEGKKKSKSIYEKWFAIPP